MSARDDVLGSIRRSLGVSGTEAIRRQIVNDRLERSPPGVLPRRGQVSGEALMELFKIQAEAALATVSEVDAAADVPQSVANFLRDHNLPASLRMGDDLRLRAMPWADTALDIAHGPSSGDDLNAISHAFGGVAETGSLVMISGSDNPSTLNFLPDNHIIVVSARDIDGDYESLWSKIRHAFGKGEMPRTVNWITGPSRSGDIEQTLLLGAHGPRRVHVIVVRE